MKIVFGAIISIFNYLRSNEPKGTLMITANFAHVIGKGYHHNKYLNDNEAKE